MTLIVIDKTGMYADTYARVQPQTNSEPVVYNDFTKLFVLPFRVYDGISHTLPRLAFSGDPLLAIHFLQQITEDHQGLHTCELSYLKSLTTFRGRDITRLLQVVFPYAENNGEMSALAVTYGHQPDPIVIRHRGEVLTFGGDKPKHGGVRTSTWCDVFRHAFDEKLLPGLDYHHLPHDLAVGVPTKNTLVRTVSQAI